MSLLHLKPDIRLIWLLVLLVPVALVASIWPSLESIWLSLLILTGVVLIYDAWSVYRMSSPGIQRNVAGALSVGVHHDVELLVRNMHSTSVCIDVFDHFPEQVEYTAMPRRLFLAVNEYAQLVYRIRPVQRGAFEFSTCECLLQSPLKLWRHKRLIPLQDTVKVYPNYAPVIEYALLSTENHLSMMGILKRRRRGQGMDFHQLREFREGDSMKQVDWKASSRMRKLIAREYQDERDQQIIVMMDCGHRMLAQDGELSHFDHSLNALLLLSYVALRQGDSVGVSTFSSDERRWVKPVKGVANINSLLNGIFDLQPGSASPDYSSGARDLLMRQRKRSLVLILTNLRDDDYEDLQLAVKLLKKYHKVVVASLQEQAIVDRLNQPVGNLQDALTVASTHEYLSRRKLLVRQLRSYGVNTLDVLPEDLALSLTNSYLELKTSGQI